jgi:hypothetical protein
MAPTMTGKSIEISFSRLDPDHMIFEGIDTSVPPPGSPLTAAPQYTVSEVAKFFFARSGHWIRWAEKKGKIQLNGKKQSTVHRTKGGARYYTLEDVEKLAHALAESNAITIDQLRHALLVLSDEALLYGYKTDGEASGDGTEAVESEG